MSQTKLGLFFKDDIKVKLVKDCDLSYFKENGYCDYRVGCDICEVGNAHGFITNIIDIIDNSDNYFYLNNLELKIKDENSWCESLDSLDVYNYYESNDKNVIKQVYKYYKKFNKLDTCISNKCDLFSENVNLCSGVGISSCFNKHNETKFTFSENKLNNDISKKINKFNNDISKIKNIHICSICYTWFICINKKYDDCFTYTHPLKYFWKDVVKDDLYDIIEFDNENKKNLFYT